MWRENPRSLIDANEIYQTVYRRFAPQATSNLIDGLVTRLRAATPASRALESPEDLLVADVCVPTNIYLMETIAVARIDEEIYQSPFFPISRLPAEILENIFMRVCDYHEDDVDSSFHIPYWVNVSYVCRHWRHVALNCPTLWTHHFTVSRRWTDELFARSKQAPLKILIKYSALRGRVWWSDLVENVLNHIEQIQELSIHAPAVLFPTRLSLYAPRLQILDLCILSPSPRTSAIGYGDFPLLHTLKLTGFSLPCHSLDLSRVTTLFLCRVSVPNIVSFLTTLSHMQALTALHIQEPLDATRAFISGYAIRVSPKFCLPNLAHFFVLAPISMVVALLSCTNIPLKTRVGLEILGENGTSIDDFVQLPILFSQRFSQSEGSSLLGPTIQSVVVRSSIDQSSFTIGASENSDCSPDMSPLECDAPLMVHVRAGLFIIDMYHIMSEICCSIPSIHVQTLRSVDPPLSSQFWRKTLSHFRGLRHMSLGKGSMPFLVSLLAAVEPLVAPEGHITSDHGPTQMHEFVPALEELVLNCIRFEFMDGVGVSRQSLLDALSTRKTRLTMINCSAEEEETP